MIDCIETGACTSATEAMYAQKLERLGLGLKGQSSHAVETYRPIGRQFPAEAFRQQGSAGRTSIDRVSKEFPIYRHAIEGSPKPRNPAQPLQQGYRQEHRRRQEEVLHTE
jgi:hypothetical protein